MNHYKELLKNLGDFLMWFFSTPALLFLHLIKYSPQKMDDSMPPSLPPEPKPEYTLPNREKILAVAIKKLGTDASPHDFADDEFGCAESVSQILNEALGGFPILLSTVELKAHLNKNPQFKGTLELKPGNIIVCPTGTGNGTIRGHAGILRGGNRIMSNDSRSGKWQDNYSVESWVDRYRTRGGFSIYVFEAL